MKLFTQEDITLILFVLIALLDILILYLLSKEIDKHKNMRKQLKNVDIKKDT